MLSKLINFHLLIIGTYGNRICVGHKPSAENHSGDISKHPPEQDIVKHRETSKPPKPTWLFVLEIVTGVLAGSLFLVAILTAFQRCKSRSSIIIPWKKSSSEKESISVYIG